MSDLIERLTCFAGIAPPSAGSSLNEPARALVREAIAEIERLRTALVTYGAHLPECCLRRNQAPCDCGFSKTATDHLAR